MPSPRQIAREVETEVRELIESIAAAEAVIVSTIERQCEALRARQMLAAKALHTRLCDAAKVYLEATREARQSVTAIEVVMPGSVALLEDARGAFATMLKVQLAVLATERAAAGAGWDTDFAGQRLGMERTAPAVGRQPARARGATGSLLPTPKESKAPSSRKPVRSSTNVLTHR